jgi:hypothetical protein
MAEPKQISALTKEDLDKIEQGAADAQELLDAQVKAAWDVAQAIIDGFGDTWRQLEPWITEMYLIFEDHGAVEPLYDPEIMGDEWEVFDH